MKKPVRELDYTVMGGKLDGKRVISINENTNLSMLVYNQEAFLFDARITTEDAIKIYNLIQDYESKLTGLILFIPERIDDYSYSQFHGINTLIDMFETGSCSTWLYILPYSPDSPNHIDWYDNGYYSVKKHIFTKSGFILTTDEGTSLYSMIDYDKYGNAYIMLVVSSGFIRKGLTIPIVKALREKIAKFGKPVFREPSILLRNPFKKYTTMADICEYDGKIGDSIIHNEEFAKTLLESSKSENPMFFAHFHRLFGVNGI